MGRRKSGTILALSQQNNNWDFFFLKGGGELGEETASFDSWTLNQTFAIQLL